MTMITKSTLIKSSVLLFCLSFSSILFAQEPENLALIKKQLIAYHDSGAYVTDIEAVTTQAENYLLNALKTNRPNKKLAIVFDIDETVISNYNDSKVMGFGGTPKQIDKMTITGTKDPIIPVRDLYYLAKKHNVSIFFITGRPESQRKVTIDILKKAGYKGWTKLYLEPNDYRTKHKSAIPYKSGIRKKIESEGYHILFSMGDQVSDFEGGYTQQGFKLPNPYYFIK